MSLLWRNRIDVFLAPGHITLAQSPGNRIPVKPSATHPAVTIPIAPPEPGHVAWEKPLQQLDEILHKNTGAGMTMTLSNHFVRYATLMPQVEITSPEEVMAYADFRMREIYGTRVDHWVISISSWNPVYGAISAAIPQELMAKIVEICERHTIRLNGIEPYFTAVLDRWEKQLDRNKSYVAVIETGRLCIGVLENNIWRNIRNQRLQSGQHNQHGIAEALWAALDQEAVLSGHKDSIEQVFLFAPEHPSLVLPPDCGWRTTPLSAGSSPAPEHYPKPLTESAEENACHA
ncbi:MAG: hypothetical protein KDE66_07420 [Nitrosomonas sp.]|nr:hypothetical protein [Nitrosomonas sp.]MCP5251720.1 hypothetical protein [Burkholderiales bacterium]